MIDEAQWGVLGGHGIVHDKMKLQKPLFIQFIVKDISFLDNLVQILSH